MEPMASPLAATVSTAFLVLIAILSVIVLILIVWSPWKKVRDEPPLDKDVETRLLLHREHPDEPTGEIPSVRVADLADRTRDDGDDGELPDLGD